MKAIQLVASLLTKRIYAQLLDGAKDADKRDVTGAACAAVAQHVLAHNGVIIVTCGGEQKYEIIVRNCQSTPAVAVSTLPLKAAL